jgi:hypothetical protein
MKERERQKNAGQNRKVRIVNISFRTVAEFKYMGITIPNKNIIQNQINNSFQTRRIC